MEEEEVEKDEVEEEEEIDEKRTQLQSSFSNSVYKLEFSWA